MTYPLLGSGEINSDRVLTVEQRRGLEAEGREEDLQVAFLADWNGRYDSPSAYRAEERRRQGKQMKERGLRDW